MTRRDPADYNWPQLRFDETILRKHFSALTSRDIRYVVVHHMTVVGKGNGSALDACWNIWQNRQASAHYGVDGNLVRQYVWDKNFAWATGSNAGNLHGISIEHANSTAGPKWLVSDTTMKTGARLVAHLHVAYKLGRPVSGKTLRQHDEFTSTACPGPFLGGTEWSDYVREAQRIYDQLTAKPNLPKPTPKPPAPKPQPKHVEWYSGSFLNMWGDDSGEGTRTFEDRLDEMVRDLTKGKPDVATGCEVRAGRQELALRKEMKAAGYPIGYVKDGNFAFFRAGTEIAYSGTYILPKSVQGEGRAEALLRVRAKVNGHWLHVGVTHLDYRPQFDALRVKQARAVIDAMTRFGIRYRLTPKHRWLVTADPNSHSWVRDKAMLPGGFSVAAKDGIDEAYVGNHKDRPVLASSSSPTASDHPVLHFTIGKKA